MPESHLDRLRKELGKIEGRFVEVLRSGRIESYARKQNPWSAFGSGKQPRPDIRFRWLPLEPSEARKQRTILEEYREVSGEILALVEGLPPEQQTPMKSAVLHVNSWIQNRSSGGAPGSIESAVDRFIHDVAELDSLLAQMQSDLPSQAYLVIDTSALLDCPNIIEIANALEPYGSELVVTSTVISELDELKSSRRSRDFVQRVRRAIRSLQELKNAGNLQEGIAVTPNMKVRVLPREPHFQSLPEWIDPSVNDDRIVASALEIQRSDPSSHTLIVSNDLNMQLKAEMGHLSTIPGPECGDDAQPLAGGDRG